LSEALLPTRRAGESAEHAADRAGVGGQFGAGGLDPARVGLEVNVCSERNSSNERLQRPS
jgi:hypothetical protein